MGFPLTPRSMTSDDLASNKGGVVKTSYFRANCFNISKTVGDTSKVTIND